MLTVAVVVQARDSQVILSGGDHPVLGGDPHHGFTAPGFQLVGEQHRHASPLVKSNPLPLV